MWLRIGEARKSQTDLATLSPNAVLSATNTMYESEARGCLRAESTVSGQEMLQRKAINSC